MGVTKGEGGYKKCTNVLQENEKKKRKKILQLPPKTHFLRPLLNKKCPIGISFLLLTV
jgi:hypothetical protein